VNNAQGKQEPNELEPQHKNGEVGGDPLFAMVVAVLNRASPASAEWETEFIAGFLASARVRRIAWNLADQFPSEMADIRQQLALTMLQKLRAQDFTALEPNSFYAMITTIGERYCQANIKGAWNTNSLDQLNELAIARGTDDNPADPSDEGHGAIAMERSAFLQASPAMTKLREYMHEGHNSPKLRESKNKNSNIHLPPASDHVVTRKDSKTLTKPDTTVKYLDLKLNKVEALLKSSPGRPPGSTNGGVVEYRRNAEQQELFEYWQASGLSQENFAASIDVSLAAFKSYIYGKTKDVPPQVIERAREVQAKTESLTEQLHKRFDFPMPKILERWEKVLGLTQARDEDIATILGVNHTTVLRWRSDDTKPKVRDLARYELQVNAWATRTAESRKKASELAPRKRRTGPVTRVAAGSHSPASK